MSYCPFKMANPTLPPSEWKCEKDGCAWWDEYWGKCSIAVEAMLRGHEDHQKEIKAFMADRGRF
jgi:hypothetical protein